MPSSLPLVKHVVGQRRWTRLKTGTYLVDRAMHSSGQHFLVRRSQSVFDLRLFKLFQQDTPTFTNGRSSVGHPPEELRMMLKSIFEPIVV
jgi:hypothetical protein